MRKAHYLGLINAEGCPRIVGDASALSQWRGVEGTDYDRACALLNADPKIEGAEIKVGMGDALVWEMGGGWTELVFRATRSHHTVVRLWPADPLDKNAPRVIADQPVKAATRLGAFPIDSGILADQVPTIVKKNTWKETIDAASVEDIVENARQQVGSPSVEDLLRAFEFYVDHDAFIRFRE